jgi:hypothetical protein
LDITLCLLFFGGLNRKKKLSVNELGQSWLKLCNSSVKKPCQKHCAMKASRYTDEMSVLRKYENRLYYFARYYTGIRRVRSSNVWIKMKKQMTIT